MAKGTTIRAVRVSDDKWQTASAAFPSERGKAGGLSAEVQGFVGFLAEHPEIWNTVKAVAASNGTDPWHIAAEALARHVR